MKTAVTEDNSIEIDGVKYTPEMRQALKAWYDYIPSIEDSLPERFYKYMSAAQDYFSRVVVDPDSEEERAIATTHMSDMIFMKDEMKHFFPRKEAVK